MTGGEKAGTREHWEAAEGTNRLQGKGASSSVELAVETVRMLGTDADVARNEMSASSDRLGSTPFSMAAKEDNEAHVHSL